MSFLCLIHSLLIVLLSYPCFIRVSSVSLIVCFFERFYFWNSRMRRDSVFLSLAHLDSTIDPSRFDRLPWL